MFAKNVFKIFLVVPLLLALSFGPAEARGLKFHIGKYKIEIGNKNIVAVIPPPGSVALSAIIPNIVLPGGTTIDPVFIDPDILFANIIFDGIGSWFSAPTDIRRSIDGTRSDLNNWADRFYQLLFNLISDFRFLVVNYGLLILLGAAVTIFSSFLAAAYVIGRQIRMGLALQRRGIENS